MAGAGRLAARGHGMLAHRRHAAGPATALAALLPEAPADVADRDTWRMPPLS